MRVFVINLEKNKERLADMMRQLEGFKIPFERFEAIYGASLARDVLACKFSRVRSYLAMMRKLAIGEIGCALSHLGVYRRMAEQNVQLAVVFEDDVVLDENFPAVMKQACEMIDTSRPQVVLFSALVAGKQIHPDGLERLKGGWGADAYLITLSAAKAVLKANYPVIIPADQWGTWTRRKQIELYRMWPITAFQNREIHGSDIGLQYRRPNVFRLVFHKAMRVVGLCIDEASFWVTGR